MAKAKGRPAEYPQNLKNMKYEYAYGGILIYPVTKELADEIVGEFPAHFRFKPAYQYTDGQQLFYMNVNRGEQHFIFSLPSTR
jgi:hypothetical protein